MKKYEEERYQFENIKNKIYPWVKESLVDHEALNGKHISHKDTPLISFVGDLMICFVIARENDTYEIIKDNMLPPEQDMEALYHMACENLARDVEFVISNTMYGAFGIIADGHHEASAIIYKHIWNMCADKLKDDLVIMIPAKDTLIFAPAGSQQVVDTMITHGNEAFNRNLDKISTKLFLYSKEQKELKPYEV